MIGSRGVHAQGAPPTYSARSEDPSFRLSVQTSTVTPSAGLTFYGSPSSLDEPETTARMEVLARALENDPDRIYEFVRNTIIFEPQFGLHKGADGVLMDGAGGAFDQAQLMIELLRAAGYTARYAYGTVSLGSEAADILKVDTAKQACLLLAAAGTPALINSSSSCTSLSGSVSSVEMLHVWVEVSIGGTWYAFDPSLKQSEAVEGIDLWDAIGTSAASAWSNIFSGVSTSAGTVSGVSQSGINTKMATYTSNLQDELIAEHTDKTLKEVVGGWEIVRVEGQQRLTSLSGHSKTTTWSGDVPTVFRATLTLAAGPPVTSPDTRDFEHVYDLASIYAWRVQGQVKTDGTLTVAVRQCDHETTFAGAYFTALATSECEEDNTIIGETPTTPVADHFVLEMRINHPYAASANGNPGEFADEKILKSMEIGKRMDVIVRTGGGAGGRRAYQAAAVGPVTGLKLVPAGNPAECHYGSPTVEECDGTQAQDWTYWNDIGLVFALGEVPVAEMGTKKDALVNLWTDLFDRTTAMLEPLSGARIFHQHSVGIALTVANIENAIDVDTAVAIAPASGDDAHEVLSALAAVASAEEAAAIHQMAVERPNGGGFVSNVYNAGRYLGDGSTLKLLTTTGDTTSLPSGVNADTKAVIETYLANDYSVIVNTTADYNAFLARRDEGSEQAWVIRRLGATSNPGGVVTAPSFRKGATDGAPNPMDHLGSAESRMISANVAGAHLGAVDMRSGSLSFSEGTEITMGQGDFPYSLSFSRSYSSSGAFEGVGDLGMGWSHNWMSSANRTSDVETLFPDGEVVSAAPTIMAILIALEGGRADTIQASLVSGIALNWWQDQARANVVNLSGGGRSARFVRLADGSWRNPASPTEELDLIGTETEYQGQEFDWTLSDRSVMEFRVVAFNSEMPGYENLNSHHNYRNVLMSWSFPTGVEITLNYSTQDATNTPYLTSVENNLGVELVFSHSTNPTETQTSTCYSNASTYYTYGAGLREAEQACYEASRRGGLLTQVSAGDDEINFTYGGHCPRNTNYCSFVLDTAARPGLRTRTYVYEQPEGAEVGNDYTDYQHVLTEVQDDGVATPRARFEWKAVGGQVAPYVETSYDAQNRATTYHSTALTYSSAKDALDGVVRQTYDDAGRLLTSADAMGRTSRATYDGSGRTRTIKTPFGDRTSFTYDARGNLTERRQEPVEGCEVGKDSWQQSWWCQTIVIKAEYDTTWNKPIKIILPATQADPNEREWNIAYNAQGLTYTVTGEEVWDAKNNGYDEPVWTTWYDTYGRVTKTRDPTGIEATQTWGGGGLPDFCLRIAEQANQSGNTVANIVTTFACDAVGNVTSVIDPRGYTTTTTYDDLRRKVSETGPSGTNIQSQWVYDLNGDLTQFRQWDHGASAWRTTTTSYSATHQPLTVTDQDGDLARICYDELDRPIAVIDGELRATVTDYNAAGQPTAIKRWRTATTGTCTISVASDAPTETRWRRFNYNAGGLLSEEIDARGNVITTDYDDLGRVIRIGYPDPDGNPSTGAPATETLMLMDQRGQLVVRKARSGTWAAMYYDALGRDSHVIEYNSGSTGFAGRNTRAAYDLAGRPIWRDVSTQVATNGTFDTGLLRDVRAYGYDDAGRLVTDQVKPEGGTLTYVLTYDYDPSGNRTSITWPGSFTATYTYDAVNRPTGVSFPGGGGTQNVGMSYDSLSRRTGIDRPGAAADTAYTYDVDNDLASISHGFVAGTGPGAVTFAYGQDAAAKITSISIDQPAFEWMPTTAYSRDYGTANALNQVSSEDSVDVEWDDLDGNMTSDGYNDFTWTYGNRLIGASNASHTATYAYDSDNRRTKKIVDSVTTRTLWSGADEMAEADGSGTILRRFIPDGSGAMDARLAVVDASSGAVTWLHTDHQGSVIATSNASGEVVGLATYSAYGEFGPGQTAPPTGSPFGYTGRQFDPETGLYQNRARYYHSRLGQFLSTDPIGTKDDLNLYLYVGLDPVNFSDPTGAYRCVASRLLCQDFNTRQDGAIGNARRAKRELDSAVRELRRAGGDRSRLSERANATIDRFELMFGESEDLLSDMQAVSRAIGGAIRGMESQTTRNLATFDDLPGSQGGNAHRVNSGVITLDVHAWEKEPALRSYFILHEALHANGGIDEQGVYVFDSDRTRPTDLARRSPMLARNNSENYVCFIYAMPGC